ncbi:MAG TPA: hypothetical protein VH351_12655 [Bryobacteraceae bacterium]|nr:hypothetical protein [Bryobacteraceae bacterium]
MRKLGIFFVLALFAWVVWAQYPNPSPPPQSGPPVGYPPGGYPPGRRPQQPTSGDEQTPPARDQKKGKKKKGKEKDERPIISAEGKTLSNDGKKLVVKVPDGRTLTMAIDQDTKWTQNGANLDLNKVVPRSTVRVDAAEEDNFDLTVTHVELLKDAPAQTAPAAAAASGGSGSASGTQTADSGQPANNDDDLLTRPTILHGPDDPNRPVLHHGKPASPPKSDDADIENSEAPPPKRPAAKAHPVDVASKESGDMDFTIDADSSQTPKRSLGSELLNQTMEWTANFMHGLPNFVCQQNTTRYMQQSRSDDWQPQDVISAQVIFEDGQDKYRNISLNGKKTSKDMMELGGQTSTGEFGSVLISLFDPRRDTEFTYARAATIGDTPVVIYDFKVALSRSDWHIIVGGQLLEPTYSGRIWVDKRTGEIRRVEQQADNIPKDFPNDTVEMAVDYEEVSLGTPTKYLVPVHAENISCQRGTQFCGKNVIEFRNYHRYAGESSITFGPN